MTATKMRPAVEQSPGVVADLITASAEKQLEALSKEHRERLCRALDGSLPSRMTENVPGLTKGLGRRVRVGRSLRIVYGFVRDQVCVVYAGLRSPAYKKFLRIWDGQIQCQFFPLSESEILMKTLQTTESQNSKQFTRKAVATARPTAADKQGAATPAAEMLWHGMLSLVAGAVEQELDETLHPLLELEREKTVHEVLCGLPDRSKEQKAMNALKSDLGRRMAVIDSAVEGLQGTVNSLADAMATELHLIREDFCRHEDVQASSVAQLGSRVTATGEAYIRLEERQEQTLRQLSLLGSRVDRSQEQWKSLREAVVIEFRKAEERECRLVDALREIRDDLGCLAERVGQFGVSVDQLQKEPTDARWRNRLGRLRDAARRWSKEAKRRVLKLLRRIGPGVFRKGDGEVHTRLDASP